MKLSFSLFFPLAASIRSVLFWFYVILLACFRHFSVFLLISITLSSLDFKTILHNIHNPLWLRKKKLCVWRFECCVCLCKFVLMWAFARFKKKKKKKNQPFIIYISTFMWLREVYLFWYFFHCVFAAVANIWSRIRLLVWSRATSKWLSFSWEEGEKQHSLSW